ncbi:MAG: hypothetical protein MI919_14750 [Holophagales bacterium]|nr:hypothetical protein [Holophagales bacterium]
MSRVSRFLFLLSPALLFPALPVWGAGEKQEEARALVIHSHGKVSFGPSTDVPRVTASTDPWAPIFDGDVFHLDPDAELLVLCDDGACRRHTSSFVGGPETCDAERISPCGGELITTSSPSERGARVLAHWAQDQHEWILVGHARGPEEHWGRDPVLVSPRCPESGPSRGCETWLGDPRELLFLAVDDARRYRFVLTGPGRWQPLAVHRDELSGCRPWPAFAGARVCRHPWPEAWGLPATGRTVRLAFEVEADAERRLSEATQRLRLGRADPRAGPAPGFSEISGLAGDLVRSLARPGDLSADLFASLAAEEDLPPSLELLLAQLYLERDFPRPAHHHFLSLVERLEELPPAREIEVYLGMALASFDAGDPARARRELQQAEAAAKRLGDAAHLETIHRLEQRITRALAER